MKHPSTSDMHGKSGSVLVASAAILLVMMVTVAIVLQIARWDVFSTWRFQSNVKALNAAEAGIANAVFKLQNRGKWTELAGSIASSQYWDTNGGERISYAVTFNPSNDDSGVLIARGTTHSNDRDVVKKVQVSARKKLPEALEFTMFGNDVGFHNHMGVNQNYGLSISNKVWSNGDILVHPGLKLEGVYTAVGTITMKTTGSVPPTDVSGARLIDGDTSTANYAPDQGDPLPEAKPFPNYNFTRAAQLATAGGTYFANAGAFDNWLKNASSKVSIQVINNDNKDNDADGKIDEADEREFYRLPIPQAPGGGIVLTSADNKKTGVVKRVTVKDAFIYVKDKVTITESPDTLLVFSNSSIVCEGIALFAAPIEFYSPATEVALASMSGIKMTDSGHSDGTGGPIHMEGIIYTLGQSHIHQSDPYNAVYLAGAEIADYIHNCEWFRQEYKAYPRMNGLSDSTETRAQVVLFNWREIP